MVGSALLGVAEVGLQELEVVKVHRKTHVVQQVRERTSSMWVKLTTDATLVGIAYLYLEGSRLVHRSLAGVHGLIR